DDEAAGNGDEDLQEAEVVAGRRDERKVPALEEEEVGEEADQSEECEATTVLRIAIATAISEIGTRRSVAVKSPRRSSALRAIEAYRPPERSRGIARRTVPREDRPLLPTRARRGPSRAGPMARSSVRWASESRERTASPRRVSRTTTCRRSPPLGPRPTRPRASVRSMSSTVLWGRICRRSARTPTVAARSGGRPRSDS